MIYLLHLITVIAIYAIVAGGLNLLVGFAGKLSLVQAAFYGLGGYAAALFALRLEWAFPAAVGFALAGGLAGAMVLGRLALRFRDEFFVLVTLALQVGMHAVYLNWEGVTGGAFGLGGIPHPVLGSWRADGLAEIAALYWVIAVLVLLLLRLWATSPFGLALQAVRDDARLSESLGKDPRALSAAAFTIAGGLAALGGALLASYVTYIDSTSFAFPESVFFLSIVILGGAGAWQGPLLGTALLVLAPEILRFVPLPQGSGPNVREILFALILLITLRYRPQGLLGRYALD